jgi:hypothetical protein
VSAAAARHDIPALLQQLSTAAATDPAGGTTPTNAFDSQAPPAAAAQHDQQQLQQQQHMPWLLPAALTLAARQLAAGQAGKPQFAQALVELVLDRGLVEPQRAQRAVHAVLQAYYEAGDYSGVSGNRWLVWLLAGCVQLGSSEEV